MAKAFNVNFASIYDQIGAQRARPSCLYCGEDDARQITEQLIADPGYDPVLVGGLEHARALEDFLPVFMGILQSGAGPTFYRFAPPGEL